MSKKKISHQDMTGDRGIALIHKIVSDMGFMWNPTGLEAGIDGYIEIRDSETGEVTNFIIQVQSKATDRDFQSDTIHGFDYYCDQRDLDYWLGGNAPVILIRSKPATGEAYWVSIKDYFKDPSTRRTNKIHFDKSKDKFDISCRDALFSLAKPRNSGIYLSPLPKNETLVSNLVKVASFGEKIYVAETNNHNAKMLMGRLRQLTSDVVADWVLKSKQIITFRNLADFPWRDLCDQGTVEEFDSIEWASSHDPERKNDFVQLLNKALREMLWPEVRFHGKHEYFYFSSSPDLKPIELPYKSLVQNTSRRVFQGYTSKKDSSKISYYRHSAFEGRFVRYEDIWYLEITPTYHFSWDGKRDSRFRQEYLKKIKQLERNPAVLGQVVMWSEYLKPKPDFFSKPYPYLTFGSLLEFQAHNGLDDTIWLQKEEREEANAVKSPANQLALFDE